MNNPESKKSRFSCFFPVTNRVVPVMLSLIFLTWSYFTYIYYLYLDHIISLEGRVPLLIIYHIILVYFFWAYYKTVSTEAYGAPDSFKLPEETLIEFNKLPIDLVKQNTILREFSRSLSIVTFTNTDDIRYCDTCKIVKPDRAHHCSLCNKCVLKMDHHCLWINNCVSFSNYKYFLLLLAYGLIMCIFIASTTLIYVIQFWRALSQTGLQVHVFKFHIILLFLFAIMLSTSLFSLLTYHIYLISKNRTTTEYFRSPIFTNHNNKNGFNLGCYKNIQEVFGREIPLWFLPINTSLGDGVYFPLAGNPTSNDRTMPYKPRNQLSV